MTAGRTVPSTAPFRRHSNPVQSGENADELRRQREVDESRRRVLLLAEVLNALLILQDQQMMKLQLH